MDARARMEKAAYVAARAGLPAEVSGALLDVKERWRDIPYLAVRPEGFELTDEVMGEQLAALRRIRGGNVADPEALATTIALDLQTPA
jgi:hypothetical protein